MIANWHFDKVQLPGYSTDPNKWTIERGGKLAVIKDDNGKLVDTPDDIGQSDLDLIIWGIGWLHANVATD